MAKKVVVGAGDREDRFESADAVRALAEAGGFAFSSVASCGKKTIVASAAAPFRIMVYRNGEPEYDTGVLTSYPRLASFSVEDAFRALVESLGVEFRAEYVVGSSKPRIVAVPTASTEQPKKTRAK